MNLLLDVSARMIVEYRVVFIVVIVIIVICIVVDIVPLSRFVV